MTLLLDMLGVFLAAIGILGTVAAIREGGSAHILVIRIGFGAVLTALGYWLYL